MDLLNFLTVREVADRIGATPNTVYVAIRQGRLTVVETPLGWLVDPASVEGFARTAHRGRHKLPARESVPEVPV